MTPVATSKSKSKTPALATALLSLFGCASASEISSVPESALVIDVRTPREFRDWHYPGALNIPVHELADRLDELGDPKQDVVVYCRSGSRSSSAKQLLTDNGFTQVKNGGGLQDMRPLVIAK